MQRASRTQWGKLGLVGFSDECLIKIGNEEESVTHDHMTDMAKNNQRKWMKRMNPRLFGF